MLTDTTVKNAKAKDSPYKLSDSHGLYLYVSPKGARSWRFDYRFNKRRRTVAFGLYSCRHVGGGAHGQVGRHSC